VAASGAARATYHEREEGADSCGLRVPVLLSDPQPYAHVVVFCMTVRPGCDLVDNPAALNCSRAHECLPDALTPALRGHEEPADLSDVVLVARADLSESDDPVLVLGDEWEALTPQWDAGGRVERRERFRLENVSESGLVAADLDDGDRPRILGYCLTNADVHLSRPSTRDSASFRRRGSRLAARSERPSLHAAVSLRAR
jgi:hypothetical protein